MAGSLWLLMTNEPGNKNISAPLALLAELSHRCPLQCLYCSNPEELALPESELATDKWINVFQQAKDLGVLQVHLSGGEPLVRGDLEKLVGELARLDLYTNLISSGIGLTQKRLSKLIENGLTNIQMSIQASQSDKARQVAGVDLHDKKLEILSLIQESGLYLTINVVLHSMNIDSIEEIVRLCTEYDANRIELANCQYHGFASRNIEHLLPTKEQVENGYNTFSRLQAELAGCVEMIWVYPDYYEETPKPCMGGWAAKQLTVNPSGIVYPCPGAAIIENLAFPSVLESSLESIWYESLAFNAFRGFDWMQEPCRSCDNRFNDFGGCRCQAYALTGNASNTDPVCHLSEKNELIQKVISGKVSALSSKPSYRKY